MDPIKAQIILLGASNLTFAMQEVLRQLRERLGGPLDVFAALGYGRSYGLKSSVFGRGLVGIKDCGVWAGLARYRDFSRPCYALIVDIGNDVLYQAKTSEIVDWLEQALGHMARNQAKTTMVQLPIANILSGAPWQYWLLRHVLFPGRDLQREDVQRRAQELAAAVAELAARHRIALVEQSQDWYGMDPIHFRRSFRRAAWRQIIGATVPAALAPSGPLAPLEISRLRPFWHTPEQRWLFGRSCPRAQPSTVLADGTRIFLY